MKTWQYLKGTLIELALLLLLVCVFRFAELYGAYLKLLGVIFVCAIIIGIIAYLGYNAWRIISDWFNGPNVSSG